MMESQITREAAWELLRKYNKDSVHLQHVLTVEDVLQETLDAMRDCEA